jgi:hypothetical protein
MRANRLLLAAALLIAYATASSVFFDYPSDCSRVDSSGRTLCSFGEKFLNGRLTDADLAQVVMQFPSRPEHYIQGTVEDIFASAHSPLKASSPYQITSCKVSAISDGPSSARIFYRCSNTLNKTQELSFSFSMDFDVVADDTPDASEYDSVPSTYSMFRLAWGTNSYAAANAKLYNHTIDDFCADITLKCNGIYQDAPTCQHAIRLKTNVQWDGVVRYNVDTQLCRMHHFYLNIVDSPLDACQFNSVCVGAVF